MMSQEKLLGQVSDREVGGGLCLDGEQRLVLLLSDAGVPAELLAGGDELPEREPEARQAMILLFV